MYSCILASAKFPIANTTGHTICHHVYADSLEYKGYRKAYIPVWINIDKTNFAEKSQIM